jgi:hypothetical protein
MKILRIIATIDPATGGPVSGLRAVTPALAKLGHESEFLTVDEPLAGYIQSFVGPVHALGPAKSSYCYSPRVRHWLDRNARNYDAIIVHGLWQYFRLMSFVPTACWTRRCGARIQESTSRSGCTGC